MYAVKTRDEYIEQLKQRYDANDLIYVPLVYSTASLNEQLAFTDEPVAAPITNDEFARFVEYIENDDPYFDNANETENYYIEQIIENRGIN